MGKRGGLDTGKKGVSEMPLFVHDRTKKSKDRHRALIGRDSTLPQICLDFRTVGFLDQPRFLEEIPMDSGPDPGFGSRKTVRGFQGSRLESSHLVGKNPPSTRKGLDLAGTCSVLLESRSRWPG